MEVILVLFAYMKFSMYSLELAELFLDHRIIGPNKCKLCHKNTDLWLKHYISLLYGK